MIRLGDRALFLGSTGSGKTTAMGIELGTLYGRRQVQVLDTKSDPLYAKWRAPREKHLRDVRRHKWPAAPMVIYEPTRIERSNTALLDAWAAWIWERRHTIAVVDELRQLAPGATPPPGTDDLISRSRGPRDITLLLGTQRPRFVPVMAYSEASLFYIFRLTSKQDREHVAGFTSEDVLRPIREAHAFFTYRAGDLHARYWHDIRELQEAEGAGTVNTRR